MVPLNRGFALLVVLWVVAILSAISLALVSSARVEARAATEQWDQLRGERLARSGQEVASYLRTRGLGQPNQTLDGLPVAVETAGFRYRLHFPEGDVDLILESDVGKINPATASPQFLQNFATIWKGDAAGGQQLTEAIQDRRDPDAEVRANGAEAGFYSTLGYAPRNSRLGIADLPLIRGLDSDDFYPKIVSGASGTDVRESLDEFFTTIPTGGLVNPNFAPLLVLRAVPELGRARAEAIVAARKEGVFFQNAEQLRLRIPMEPESAALGYFRFDQWVAPAVLTIARSGSAGAVHSERRIYEMVLAFNSSQGTYESRTQLHRIELNHLPGFLMD